MIQINKIKGLEHIKDYYYITDDGNVISLYRNKERELKQNNVKGYMQVKLYCEDKSSITISVHRLVALAFIPNPDNKSEINHKDEDKENNSVDNLEWCDRKYNVNYGTRNKRSGRKGELSASYKPISHYEKNPITRSDFKKRCITHNVDFNEFEEILSGIFYIDKKNNKKKSMYYYKQKEMKINVK